MFSWKTTLVAAGLLGIGVPTVTRVLAQPRAQAQARLTVSSVQLETNAELASLIRTIRAQAREFVFLSGGASGMSDEAQRQLMAMFGALAQLTNSGRQVAVGDGGTYAGIMRAAGDARSASGNAFLLIGVPPAKEIPPRGKTPADPNHSHIVAVDNPAVAADQDAWGSETETMYWLFGRLADGRPSVTVVANGGGITLSEVAANVKAGRPMIVIEGSGRAADALVSLLRKTTPASDEIRQLRERAEAATLTERPELFHVVSLREGADGLHAALTRVLDRRPRSRTRAAQIWNGRCLANAATDPSVKRFGVCVAGIPALIVPWNFT